MAASVEVHGFNSWLTSGTSLIFFFWALRLPGRRSSAVTESLQCLSLDSGAVYPSGWRAGESPLLTCLCRVCNSHRSLLHLKKHLYPIDLLYPEEISLSLKALLEVVGSTPGGPRVEVIWLYCQRGVIPTLSTALHFTAGKTETT